MILISEELKCREEKAEKRVSSIAVFKRLAGNAIREAGLACEVKAMMIQCFSA